MGGFSCSSCGGSIEGFPRISCQVPREHFQTGYAGDAGIRSAAMRAAEEKQDVREVRKPDSDSVNHPSHYNNHPSGVECVVVSEHYMGNVSKAIDYIWRHEHKGNPVQDLEKAVWFLNREIRRLKEKQSK